MDPRSGQEPPPKGVTLVWWIHNFILGRFSPMSSDCMNKKGFTILQEPPRRGVIQRLVNPNLTLHRFLPMSSD